MKKLALAFISLSLSVASFSQTLFTYGKHKVTQEEFLRAFNKNPSVTEDRKQALKEYLDLYINFKLKVQAAYDAGLDKEQSQQFELQNFRRQIAENYINEQANIKALVKEAFERSQKDIHLAHVFIEVPTGTDTADAYKRIHEAYKALQSGKEFAKVAAEFSSDEGTRRVNGDLGFVTVFTLPYEFENIAYNTKPNTYSVPVRTSIGYHIFKNIAERKPLGTRRVAQIMIAFPPNATTAERSAAARKADSVYQLITKGNALFENMVTAVSNDLSSNQSAGQLPEFGVGTYNPVFEQVAFSLTKNGEVSKPFATDYGYHIVKLLEAKPVSSDSKDELFLGTLQEKIMKDQRLEEAKKQVIFKQLALLKYKQGVYNQKDLFAFTDSAWQKQTPLPYKNINENTVIFSFAKQQVKAGDWAKFVRAVKTSQSEYAGLPYSELLKEYVRITADEYYRNNMEDYNPAFSRQLQEFKDANMLFGIMEKMVWGKSSEDTLGLKKYYEANKAKYKWAPSADALILTVSSEKVAEELEQKLRGNAGNWRSIVESYNGQVVADSGRYELGQLPVLERTNFTAGVITAPVPNPTDGTFTFNYLLKVYRESDQRSFEDARGMVISDYQQVLEDEWIAALKKTYPVKVNEAVFKAIK